MLSRQPFSLAFMAAMRHAVLASVWNNDTLSA